MDVVDTPSYPKKKSRDLSNKEKQKIRERVIELEEEEIEQSMSQTLADEFNCSPSQIAGIMAHM
jgi:transcriptional regulator CtsR